MISNLALFQKIWEALKKAKLVLAASHQDPDGDAVASVLAFKQILESVGVEATAYLPSSPSKELSYLPDFNNITREPLNNFDLLAALDYGDWPRLEIPFEVPDKKIITLDHHPQRGQRGKWQVIEPEASSTCEVIYNFCKANDIKITRDLAVTLLTGIVTDTGSFQHANTLPATLEVVEDLMLKGAPLPKVMKRLAVFRSPAILRAWGEALHKVAVDEKLGVASVVLARADLDELQISPDDLSGFASLLSTIPNARCALTLIEEKPGEVRGSLRSEGPLALNVGKIAEALGGGGHERAAGFTMGGELEEVLNLVKKQIQLQIA